MRINRDFSYKEKTCYASKDVLDLHNYKNPKTLKKKVRIIYLSSNTLELWEILTWPSEDIWSAPHQCSLLGLLFLLCRYCFERAKAVWLTGDFSASLVGAVYGKRLRLVSHTNATRTKSCMVLTRSMVTTNNVQGDESWPTTLKRQVQTLTTVVECLTKQNQDLKEQLRQKNAAIGTQKKDQEGTSAKWRN